jgi:hypothetical protein
MALSAKDNPGRATVPDLLHVTILSITSPAGLHLSKRHRSGQIISGHEQFLLRRLEIPITKNEKSKDISIMFNSDARHFV